MAPHPFVLRPAMAQLEESRIREVANAGLGRSDVLAFWFGESDEVTPEPIRAAAMESLQQGDTFYSHNLGLPALREAIAAYMSGLHGPVSAERIAVTPGGVNALMVTMQALIDPGDEVVVVTPVWPNLVAQPQVMGARVRCVALQPVAHGPQAGLWQLPMQQLLDALTPGTRVLVLNAPNNPTGWTLSRDEQQVLLEHCRSRGIWIVADEVYERLYYPDSAVDTGINADQAPCAPSFLDVALPDDRLVVVHSFSKSFLMTGWRLGWMVMPSALVHPVSKLIEFNTSCSPVFVQKAGLAALMHEPDITPRIVAHLRRCRQRLIPALHAIPGVTVAAPPGGMYAFFKLDGIDDSLAAAKRLVAEAGLGLAPGTAFAPEAQGWLRWCFASKDLERLSQGVERLKRWRAL